MSLGRFQHFFLRSPSDLLVAAPASSLLTGLINHWELTADVNNSVSGGLALTNNGGVAFTGGRANIAVSGDKYLSLASAVRGFGNPVSVSIWYQQTAALNDQTAIQIGNNGGTPNNFLKIESNYTYIGGATGAADLNSTGHAATTSLVHEMIVVNGTSIKRYRNGVLTSSSIASAMADVARLLLIGAFSNGGAPSVVFNGTVFKVSNWNLDKSADASNVYNAGTPLTYPFTGTP